MTTEPLVRESDEILAMYPKVQAQLLRRWARRRVRCR